MRQVAGERLLSGIIWEAHGPNVRTDAYGGKMENRARLILEVTATVVQEIGGERTGVPDFASFAYK